MPENHSNSLSNTSQSSSIHSFPIQNINQLVPIKLKKDNFLTWKSLFLPVLKSFDLIDHVDGSVAAPAEFIQGPDSTRTSNPEYKSWQQTDQMILIWLNATISESYLPYVIGFHSARDLWKNLEKRFASLSRSHVLQLRARLQTVRKGSSSVTTYLQELKEISDSLAASGNVIQDADLVFYILNGLPSEYDSFATSVRVREPIVTSDELHSLLLTEELTIEARSKLQINT